jgi:hypothetical protein
MNTNQKSNEAKAGCVYIMNINDPYQGMPVEKNPKLENKLARLKATLPYQIEYAKGGFADELWEAMEHRGLNQVGFSQKAEVPKQFLTKVFRGGNCTIETMVRLAFALNYKLNVHLTPNEVGCVWMHSMDNLPEIAPRPPEQFINLLTESRYKPMVEIEEAANCEKLAA